MFRAQPAPRLDPATVISLQRTAGNASVASLLGGARPMLQRAPRTPLAVPARPGANAIPTFLTALQMLKASRIEAWRKTASSPEPKPGEHVLEILIAIASEGVGGVVYAVIDRLIAEASGKLLAEFVKLASLEAGDLAAEGMFRAALTENRHAFEASARNAVNEKEQTARTAIALVGDGDIIDAYAELLTVHSIVEFTEQSALFSGLSGDDAAARSAALQLTFERLKADPSEYMAQLTAGFIRLLDAAARSKQDGGYDGDHGEKWRDPDMDEGGLHPGNVVVFPWPRSHSLGKWFRPELGFSGFNASAEGMNTRTLSRLRSAKIRDLPVTMSFRLKVDDPFHRIFEGDMGLSEVRFTREPGGTLHFAADIAEDALEWLASYYTQSAREYDDHERRMGGLLGMQKLYNAIRDTPITQINEDY